MKPEREKTRIDITLRIDSAEQYDEKIEKLLKIYNVKTYSALIKILIEAEMRRQGL